MINGDTHIYKGNNFSFYSSLQFGYYTTPWPSSYKPPQLPMYDGHSDLKQFLMSYEATISSYGGNIAVMAKSFVMAVRSVAQTWYSSIRLGTITSWKKLKDMLVTSFQGFQTKPAVAEPLELFQIKCLSPTLEARPHLNRNKSSVPRI
jgi:hypothetical protein